MSQNISEKYFSPNEIDTGASTYIRNRNINSVFNTNMDTKYISSNYDYAVFQKGNYYQLGSISDDTNWKYGISYSSSKIREDINSFFETKYTISTNCTRVLLLRISIYADISSPYCEPLRYSCNCTLNGNDFEYTLPTISSVTQLYTANPASSPINFYWSASDPSIIGFE